MLKAALSRGLQQEEQKNKKKMLLPIVLNN